MNTYYLGIDLGSTTSKAVIINQNDEIIGRGITNTRANYKVAADIAKLEASYDARFTLLVKLIKERMQWDGEVQKIVESLKSIFQYEQFKRRIKSLSTELYKTVDTFPESSKHDIKEKLSSIMDTIVPIIKSEFIDGDLGSKNQFFRDIVSQKYNELVEQQPREYFEPLMLAFDKSITPVENEMYEYSFKELIDEAFRIADEKHLKDYKGANDYAALSSTLKELIAEVSSEEIVITTMVGTGYGRALLPFPEDCIKSEILCHAFGAHAIFPKTRTVLDIGGQDTKAIQVDSYGLVTSFHMNDRCAAGCGRYLGYIADEFSLSLNELGPEALEADKETTICSTCTVFAGAEVRELLNVGEKRSNILAGLHKAIVMRAMSLIARSGGVRNEFTFTGGVARNQAVLKYVSEMVSNSYGKDIVMNIHTDSIFMGALGAAMFARRNIKADLPPVSKKSELSN